jgi:hypothetical protein
MDDAFFAARRFFGLVRTLGRAAFDVRATENQFWTFHRSDRDFFATFQLGELLRAELARVRLTSLSARESDTPRTFAVSSAVENRALIVDLIALEFNNTYPRR